MSSMKAVFRLNHCPYLFLLRSISLSFSLSFDVLTRLTWTRDAVLGSSVFVVQTVLLNRTPYPPAKGTSERTKQKTVHSRIQYKEVVCKFASKWTAEKEEWNGSVHMRLALSTIICHCYRIWIQMNCMLELPLWGRRFTSKPIEWCVGCCSAAHRNTRYCLMQSTRTHRIIIKADCIHFEIICWRERRHRKKKWAATTRTDSISIFNGDTSHWTSHTPNKRATRPQTNCASGGRIVNLKKQQTKNEHKMKTHNSFTCGNYNDWHMLLVFIQDCA